MLMHSRPILSRFIVWIIFPIILLVGFGYQSLLQSLPVEEGTIHVKGLDSSVKVVRDEHAVAHIVAKTDQDAFYTLGYVHAQERLWQMIFKRRAGQGRLSEVLGMGALQNDKQMRTLGLYRAAKSALESLDESARQSLISYTKGVNAWINEEHTLPVEFLMLDLKPEPWKPEDSLLLIKLMAQNLAVNYSFELELELLIKEVGLTKANEMMRFHDPKFPPVAKTTGLTDTRIAQGLLAQNNQQYTQFQTGLDGVGSNAWAVSGKLTKSGKPLLASDPHLPIEMPTTWYLAALKGDKLDVVGATFPGVPLVFMGHNQSISWGTTNMMADVQDVFLEKINPNNEDQYEVDGQWVDMEIDEEVIHIRESSPTFLTNPIKPVKWQVRRTRHGPLISDSLGRADYPFSLRWTALDKKDRTYQSYLNINYAQNWDEFKAAFKDYNSPAINFIYADVHGDIGFMAGGNIPVRPNSDGRLPVIGWDSSNNWKGYIPLEDMPQVLNPEKGYVLNANEQNHDDDYPYFISMDWGISYRSNRIKQLLDGYIKDGTKLEKQHFVEMQGDLVSLQAQELLPFLRNLTPQNADQEDAINEFKNWDGLMSTDSVATALYSSWLHHFNTKLLSDDLRGSLMHESRANGLQATLIGRVQIQFVTRVLLHKDETQDNWCDNIHSPKEESCEQLALMALDAAIDELDKFFGFDTEWGEIHENYYRHTIFTNTRILNSIFDRTIASPGDRTTLSSANWVYSEDFNYETMISSTYRQVIDLDNWKNSGFITGTGQSGNVMSDHYDDYIEPFMELALWPMHLDSGQESGEESTITLEPSNSKLNEGGQ